MLLIRGRLIHPPLITKHSLRRESGSPPKHVFQRVSRNNRRFEPAERGGRKEEDEAGDDRPLPFSKPSSNEGLSRTRTHEQATSNRRASPDKEPRDRDQGEAYGTIDRPIEHFLEPYASPLRAHASIPSRRAGDKMRRARALARQKGDEMYFLLRNIKRNNFNFAKNLPPPYASDA